MKWFVFWFKNKSLNFVPKSPIDNDPALARRRIGDNPLSEPMVTPFTDAYVWHQGSWVKYTRHDFI